ncbi:hypothetical protein [Sphingobium sp. Sx8-8]|nr:hypothetical protein [Sphingobium sp. Sx8-8]
MTTGNSGGQDERKERLAQALRDNLRRRKAQARESRDAQAPRRDDDATG